MLVTPRKDSYSSNLNNNKMSLSPHSHRHHHYGDDNSHHSQITEPQSGKCYSPRPGHKAKQPPHINISPPDESPTSGDHFSRNEELDNDMFQSMVTSPAQTSTATASDEKHEVFSGRLYIIRHTGSPSSTSSSPTRSPSRSPSRSTVTPSPFRFSPPPSSQHWSPQNSPTSSPKTKNCRKMPVFVKVYRCNLDHFAVISRDALYTSRPVYLNLRHCRIMPGDCLGRFIVAGQCDSGNVIEFETTELSTLGQWLDAFHVYTPPGSPNRIVGNSGSGVSSNTPPIPRSPALPTLTETDEED